MCHLGEHVDGGWDPRRGIVVHHRIHDPLKPPRRLRILAHPLVEALVIHFRILEKCKRQCRESPSTTQRQSGSGGGGGDPANGNHPHYGRGLTSCRRPRSQGLSIHNKTREGGEESGNGSPS